MIRFEQTGRRGDGEILYRLIIGDEVVREGMTLDEVIVEINRRDFADLGERHTPGRCGGDTSSTASGPPSPPGEGRGRRRR